MTPESPTREYAAIHRIKVAAIVAVLFTHAGVTRWDPRWSSFDELLRTTWVSFHVPSFLFVSGFLYWRPDPISIAQVLLRLRRIVIPYLVASVVALSTGLYKTPPQGGVLFALATGSAVGVYYYVFLIVCLTPLIWFLSRVPVGIVCAALATLLVYFTAATFSPAILPPQSWFWGVRDPLYVVHFFLAGWIVRDRLALLREPFAKYRWLLVGVAAATAALYFAVSQGMRPGGASLLVRAAYTAAIMGCIATFPASRPVAPLTRWISVATFTLYLYHPFFSQMLTPVAQQLPAAVRVFALVTAEFAGAATIVVVGRLVLRDRSVALLGA